MKKISFTLSLIIFSIFVNAQEFKVNMPTTPAHGDINSIIGNDLPEHLQAPPPAPPTQLDFSNTRDNNSITIKNIGYEAQYLYIYAYEYTEWRFVKSIRIPGGSIYRLPIGSYENYFDYGYRFEGDSQISTFPAKDNSI